ncbi:hypothetical protein KIN20_022443 [Parelaphostrongylus tenuis]|uniref:Uncharacterized protein n=1 Tax=Parelaphostrongylus tenuis TaxID=148309 RepID=A0AAD5QUS5_PARTN|nr:hypothetical protein KIN20_022443 [Parelaphostrongylus tenuis]
MATEKVTLWLRQGHGGSLPAAVHDEQSIVPDAQLCRLLGTPSSYVRDEKRDSEPGYSYYLAFCTTSLCSRSQLSLFARSRMGTSRLLVSHD